MLIHLSQDLSHCRQPQDLGLKTMTQNEPYVITIDGPSGSGKGSLASRIARKLGFHLLDSGAIYRLAALKAQRQNVDLTDAAAVLAALETFEFHFEGGSELCVPFLDGEEVSSQVRLESIGDAASVIAAYPEVRDTFTSTSASLFRSTGARCRWSRYGYGGISKCPF